MTNNTVCVEVGREVSGTLCAGAVLAGSIVIIIMVALALGTAVHFPFTELSVCWLFLKEMGVFHKPGIASGPY